VIRQNCDKIRQSSTLSGTSNGRNNVKHCSDQSYISDARLFVVLTPA